MITREQDMELSTKVFGMKFTPLILERFVLVLVSVLYPAYLGILQAITDNSLFPLYVWGIVACIALFSGFLLLTTFSPGHSLGPHRGNLIAGLSVLAALISWFMLNNLQGTEELFFAQLTLCTAVASWPVIQTTKRNFMIVNTVVTIFAVAMTLMYEPNWKVSLLYILFINTISTVYTVAMTVQFTTNIVSQEAINILGHDFKGLEATSENLKTYSETVANGTNDQAAALEEASASLEEISSITKVNVENTQRGNQAMQSIQSEVEESEQSVNEATMSMDQIVEISKEISKVIETIDEIAFQTNLLALNAAVEAARAGEQGKGFAVVADAVRALAKRSAEAAKETEELIHSSTQKIEQGTKTVSAVKERFESITTHVNKAAILLDEISQSSNEQFEGINQVLSAITLMDESSQRNAQSADQLSKSATDMKGQSAMFQEIIEAMESTLYAA
jgi:uncharacterized protein YoxC